MYITASVHDSAEVQKLTMFRRARFKTYDIIPMGCRFAIDKVTIDAILDTAPRVACGDPLLRRVTPGGFRRRCRAGQHVAMRQGRAGTRALHWLRCAGWRAEAVVREIPATSISHQVRTIRRDSYELGTGST